MKTPEGFPAYHKLMLTLGFLLCKKKTLLGGPYYAHPDCPELGTISIENLNPKQLVSGAFHAGRAYHKREVKKIIESLM